MTEDYKLMTEVIEPSLGFLGRITRWVPFVDAVKRLIVENRWYHGALETAHERIDELELQHLIDIGEPPPPRAMAASFVARDG